jgi:hypothetical protein
MDGITGSSSASQERVIRRVDQIVSELPGTAAYTRLAKGVLESHRFRREASRALQLDRQLAEGCALVSQGAAQVAEGLFTFWAAEGQEGFQGKDFDRGAWDIMFKGISWTEVAEAVAHGGRVSPIRLRTKPSEEQLAGYAGRTMTQKERQWLGQVLTHVWGKEDLRRLAREASGCDADKRRAIGEAARDWAERRHGGQLNMLFVRLAMAGEADSKQKELFARKHGLSVRFDPTLWSQATRDVDWLSLAEEPHQSPGGRGPASRRLKVRSSSDATFSTWSSAALVARDEWQSDVGDLARARAATIEKSGRDTRSVMVVIGLIALVGGVYALRRKLGSMNFTMGERQCQR